MVRPTIDDLKPTRDRKWWPSLAPPGPRGEFFEAAVACELQDAFRAKSALKAASLHSDQGKRKAARKLAKKLNYKAVRRATPKSLASSKHVRGIRSRVFSHVWRFVDKYDGPVTTATVIKRGSEYTPDELDTVDVTKLLNSYLADLDRRGAGNADGWLIGFLHGEWETPAEIYRLHLHMIVAGQMIAVVDKLRKGRCYWHEDGDSVRCRVRIDRKPLTDLPHPLTYCFKGYWPRKHVIIGANGKRRTRGHKRIPEPHHTQVLQFLDRHSLSDLVVLKHVSVKGGRLKVSKPKRGTQR